MKSSELVIDRAKWRNGSQNYNKYGHVLLLDDHGMMCCLGFDSIRCGLKPGNIRYKLMPSCLSKTSTKKVKHLINGLSEYRENSDLATRASEINDNVYISRRERERQLKDLYEGIGVKVKFIGRSPK